MRLRINAMRETRFYDEKAEEEFERLLEQAEKDKVDLPNTPQPKMDVIAELSVISPKELSSSNDCMGMNVLLKQLPDGSTIGDEFEVHFERVPTFNKIGAPPEEYYPTRRRRRRY